MCSATTVYHSMHVQIYQIEEPAGCIPSQNQVRADLDLHRNIHAEREINSIDVQTV